MKAAVFPTLLLAVLTGSLPAPGAPSSRKPTAADLELAEYFRTETAKLADRCLTDKTRLNDWESDQAQSRRELQEMLGLWPPPERTELKPMVTGRVEHEAFIVEKLHFQSRPRLYVTANLYLPKSRSEPAPTILYLCGHGPVIKDGVSYGNKVAYQHHGAWFARHGYACLVLDTLQLGEIPGLHHGTYREGLWWWNARGYSPAGVEAWNSIRALDYLQTRPEVDTNRFGVTGRSGGGAYTWWVAALDDRVKVAAPVAGITDLQNHVVDGAVEGHCDCMFIVNTYRWDYPRVAGLVAPRPLLIANSDNDSIFPLDGVLRLHAKVRKVYQRCQASTNLGLLITQGPHKDTQDLQLPVFGWFNRRLKGEDPIIETAATKLFEPEQLKVFDALPADAINAQVQEEFVLAASAPTPQTEREWEQQRKDWLSALKNQVFAGWPEEAPPLDLVPQWSVTRQGLQFQAYDFTSQEHVRLRLYLVNKEALTHLAHVELNIVGQASGLSQTTGSQAGPTIEPEDCPTWEQWLALMRAGFESELREELQATPAAPHSDADAFGIFRKALLGSNSVVAFVAPRGIGLTAWDPGKHTHLRRRFMLLGQTLDGMRAWDVRRATQALRAIRPWGALPLRLRGRGDMAGHALYASLFEPNVASLELWALPGSHRQGPDYLNILRFLDTPQAIALASEQTRLRLYETAAPAWDYPRRLIQRLGWSPDRLAIRADKLKDPN